MNIDIIAFVFIFILGTIIGSFLNVVIYRFNSGYSISKGRSMCMSCSRTLRYYELIPLFSFLLQKGKCRTCSTKISYQYPLVEFSTALIFVLTAFHFKDILDSGRSVYVGIVTLYAFIFSLLIVIAVYDYRHKIIPDRLVYIFTVVSFLSLFVNTDLATLNNSLFIVPTIWQLLAGPILALPFAFLWFVSRGRWIGFGDAKLMLGVGFLLGLSSGFTTMILSFWIGAIVGIVLINLKKKTNMKTEIPFAPFIILACFIVFFLSLGLDTLVSLFTL